MSPYARFNLRRNPFGELTCQERAELAVLDPRQWLVVLSEPGAVLQFVGPSGGGKTTHLLALARCLPDAEYVYLPEDGPRPAIPARRPLLIDEAQRLSRAERRLVFHAGGPLALASHDDLAAALRRHGLAVTTVNVAQQRSPAQLAQILNRRIEASRLGLGQVPRVDDRHALTLLRFFGTDIRAIEQHLYAEFQHAAQKGLPWPPAS
jgi:energy-coupling factor transporter ATP-binding protein EcfA2